MLALHLAGAESAQKSTGSDSVKRERGERTHAGEREANAAACGQGRKMIELIIFRQGRILNLKNKIKVGRGIYGGGFRASVWKR